MAITTTFVDLDMNFKKHPLTNDLIRRSDVDAVRQSIRNLLMTRKGERPFHPEIGSKMLDFLFDQQDPQVKSLIDLEIRTTVSNFEPRANITNVNVNVDGVTNEITVEVEFVLVNTTQGAGLRMLIKG